MKTTKHLINIVTIALVFLIITGCNKEEQNQDTTSIYLTALDDTIQQKPMPDMPSENDTNIDLPMNNQMSHCSNDVVEIKIQKKLSPKEVLEELFNYQQYDKQNKAYNVFGLSNNLKIENLLIKNDFAILTLSGDIKINDTCEEVNIYNQIRKTLTQFDEIEGADIFVGDRELSEYLSSATENK